VTQFFERIAALEREHASFAIATVVARRSPVSSHLGDRALVFPDGRMEGFVGGSCSRDIVRRQGIGSLRSRRPLLLQIRPEAASTDAPSDKPAAPNTERVVIPMSCSSEGAVDVYIEPHVPLRRLVVVGFTPVAEALAQLATALDYDVVHVVAGDERSDLGPLPGVRVVALAALRDFLAALVDAEREALIAIVASQGHYDELALEVLLAFPPAFTGLLASRRRAGSVLGVLAQHGVSEARLATIRNPVGLDIGARSPGEVAVSILAEIIALAPSGAVPEIAPRATAVDPVCGMEVDLAGALNRLDIAGETYVFCGAGCRASFASEPTKYLVALARP